MYKRYTALYVYMPYVHQSTTGITVMCVPNCLPGKATFGIWPL